MTIRLLLVEDHDVVRQGLRALLELEPDIAIVGEAANGLAVEGLIEATRPQVVLMDLMLPGLSGLAVIHRIYERTPHIGIVVLTMQSEIRSVIEAVQAGARAYVLKGSGIQEVIKAIRAASNNQRYLSPPLTEEMLMAYANQMQDTLPVTPDSLTTREREVLILAAKGLTNAEIAENLVIGQRTVETHRANMMRKLGLNTQIDLMRFALKHGLIQL
jgi:DNA-binding NarL/FixJ family response regulator